MNNFLQKLLILVALALCGLVAVQWMRETRLKREVQGLADRAREQTRSMRELEQTARRYSEEIHRLDNLKKQLSGIVQTNELEFAELTAAAAKAKSELDRNQAQLASFKTVLEKANAGIARQNDIIKTQNEQLLQLARERNAAISNMNKVTREFNELVERWNKQQEALASEPGGR